MDIESIKRKLLIKYPLFGSIMANAKFISDTTEKTAATDGKDIFYNPSFIEPLTSDEQVFIFAHEVSHIAFNHIFRSEGKDDKLWNIATDSVINASLKDDGLPLVKGVVDIADAINHDAEEMYKKLIDRKNELENNKEDFGNDELDKYITGHNDLDDAFSDNHTRWAKAIEEKHKKEENSSSKKEKEKDKDKEKDKAFNEFEELGEREVFKENKVERKKQLDDLRKSLASQSLGKGDTTNSEKRNVGDVGKAKPLIDWRMLLKETVKYDVDWSYQNAGIEDGVLTAYLEETPRPETEIVLDTSGSIKEDLLRNFLRECKNILQTSKVKVGCFDTKFYGFTEIRNDKDIDDLEFYGGGGTDFCVAVNAFTRRVENKIIFTDGYSDMPDKPIDAIWVVFGSREIHPLGGKVIYIDKNQLMDLYVSNTTNKGENHSRKI